VRSLRIGALLSVLLVAALASEARAQLTTVDLNVLYTQGVVDRYGSEAGALTRIQHILAVSNQIYEDSESGIRLRLVHAEQVAYSDSARSSDALEDLSFGGAPLHQLAASLREQYGADLTTLMRPYANDGSCGIAWLGGPGSGGVLRSWDADYAYSHVSIDCSDYVLAHELGHNMGLGHSRRQDPDGGTFPFSVGHGVDGLFTTVMAYESAFGAPKIHKFSHPGLDCLGAPCGVSRSNPSNGADAVYSLEVVRDQLAAYRDEVEPSDPTDPTDPVDPDDPVDPTDPTDPVDPDDPDVAPPVPGEIRIVSPKKGKRRIKSGRQYEITWDAAGVTTVDLAYRTSEKLRRARVEAPAWTPITAGVTGNSLTWTAPEIDGRRPKLQLRLIGRDALGREVAQSATRRLRVKARKP